MTTNQTTRKSGRPESNTSRADESARPADRVPIHGSRDILKVMQGKNPGFVYRWVKDVQENGARILRFLQAGYELVRSDEEGIKVGQNHVYKSSDDSSLIAVKEDVGYNYLMKIRREWYEVDQASKSDKITQTERAIKRRREIETDDGYYGEPKISSKVLP